MEFLYGKIIADSAITAGGEGGRGRREGGGREGEGGREGGGEGNGRERRGMEERKEGR